MIIEKQRNQCNDDTKNSIFGTGFKVHKIKLWKKFTNDVIKLTKENYQRKILLESFLRKIVSYIRKYTKESIKSKWKKIDINTNDGQTLNSVFALKSFNYLLW